MKRIEPRIVERSSRRKMILIGLTIYIVVLALAIVGAALIALRDHDRMELIITDEAQYYRTYGHLRADREAADNIVIIYNADLTIVAMSNRNRSGFDPEPMLSSLAKTAMREGYTRKLGFSLKVDRFFYFACAKAICNDAGEVENIICLTKETQSLLLWIIAAFVIVTLVALAALLSVVSIYKNDEKSRNLRNSYIANVSHSLKSPISSIRAMAEAMNDGLVTDPDKIAEFSSLILSETAALEKTVTEMLELSRMQTQRVDFTKTNVYADDLFGPIISKYSVLCDDMGIGFYEPELNSIPSMWTNPQRVRELMDILLNNALKFVGNDGKIWLEIEHNNYCVTVCVRDNGIGISKEDQPRVFERFFKGSSAMNEKGSGLGLPIARGIVIGLNEKIWFKSKEGSGTSFYFTIHTSYDAGVTLPDN